MASGNPRDYGRRPHQLNKGETFDSVARKDTDLARRARGEKWKHSDDKKPYAVPPFQGYDDMERTNTPYLKFPSLSLGDLDLGGTYPWDCICLGEFGKPIGLSRSVGCDAVSFDIKIPEGGLLPTATSDNADAEDEVHVNCFKAHVYTEGQIIDPRLNADASFWRAVLEGRLPNPATTQYICAHVKDCEMCSVLLMPDCANVCEERTITINYGYGQSFDLLLVPDPSCGGNCGTLTITDADGSPATDTILQNGTNQFGVSGCAGNIVWSVSSYDNVYDGVCGSGTPPAMSGSTLNANRASGRITITASCAACNTSDSLTIQVTNSGSWGSAQGICDRPCGSTNHCEIVVEAVKYVTRCITYAGCLAGSCDGCTDYCGCNSGTPSCIQSSEYYVWGPCT